MVKKKAYKVEVIFNELNSWEYLTNVLIEVLGYEVTQAANCASIIMDKGSYIVKSYGAQDLDIAKATIDMLEESEVPARLIQIKK